MTDSIRVCQWGTFDAANYGDQLFPLIASDQLTARLPSLELTCYAPIGHASLPPGSPPLLPLVPGGGPLSRQRREHFARRFDAVIVGGGDLLRFDLTEPGYDNSEHPGPARPYDAFLDFLWGESSIHPNILWNAPGVPFAFESTRRLLVQQACSFVRYAAVRDEISRAYLLEAGVEGPIQVVPDSGILLAELIRQRVDGGRVDRLLRRLGVEPKGRKILCFQCSPGFLRKEQELVARALASIADKWNLAVLLLPVGHCHNDLEALRLVQRASGGRFTLAEDVESPLEIGALIGACDYFVGSSLHGNLTAISFGVPQIVVNNPLRAAKLEGLVQLGRLEEFRITDWGDLESDFDRLVTSPRERWKDVGDGLKVRASKHFDRLADLILRSFEERRKHHGERHDQVSGPERPALDGRGPFEAYVAIAELHERLDDERASRRAAEQRSNDSGRLLRRQASRLEHFENRVGQWETQRQTLQARTRDLETRLRSLQAENNALNSRILSMERSRIWRLLAPYRRLRAGIRALTRIASPRK